MHLRIYVICDQLSAVLLSYSSTFYQVSLEGTWKAEHEKPRLGGLLIGINYSHSLVIDVKGFVVIHVKFSSLFGNAREKISSLRTFIFLVT